MTPEATFQWAYQFLIYGDTPRKGEKLWRGEQGRHDPTAADPHPTLNGVTQRAYEAFRGDSGHSVMAMTPAEQETIYYRNYWLASSAGKLAAMDKPNLALCHFVTAVNTGLKPAAKMLQRAIRNESLHVEADGIIGPKTLDACLAADDHEASVKYTGQLVRFYRALVTGRPELAANLKGWQLRTSAIQREIGLI